MVQLTKQVIESVSKELNYPFVNDRQLFTNLFAHLSLRFTKKHLFINEYNPFSEEIKGKHPALFLAIQSACKQLIWQLRNDNSRKLKLLGLCMFARRA